MTTDPALLPLRWQVREPPLPATAAAATGRAAVVLARHLLSRPGDSFSLLSGIASADLLLVIGPTAALPWVDGVQYLGRDPDAPALLLSTTLRPAVPLPLVERAVMLRRRGAPAPTAVLLDPPLLVPLEAARTLDPAVLRRWLEARAAA